MNGPGNGSGKSMESENESKSAKRRRRAERRMREFHAENKTATETIEVLESKVSKSERALAIEKRKHK